MSELLVGVIGVAFLLVLVGLGMRIAFAAALVGVIGVSYVSGWNAGASLSGYLPQSLVGTYSYSVIPLFIIMGYFAFYAGITHDLYRAGKTLFGHFPGGLAIGTAWASAGFAACSGASTAASAVLGRMAIPEMLDAGYDKKMAAGVVAMGGCLAALIPPSALMVIYGIITEQSIAAILLAGFLPGLLTAFVYSILIYVWARMYPEAAPTQPPASWKNRLIYTGKAWGVGLLALLVIGGIYSGVFTPTEAGGVGAFAAFMLCVGTRKLTFAHLKDALKDSARTTVMIFAIMVGISILIRFFALTGLSKTLSNFVLTLPVPPLVTLIGILMVYVLLGMFMDALSMMMLTLPVFFPAVVALGYDPIWFGIIVIKMAEICLVTPPVGLNCYVINSAVPIISLEDVFRGIAPFLVAEAVVLALLILFPDIALLLPKTMSN